MTVPTPGVPVKRIRKNIIFSLVCDVSFDSWEEKMWGRLFRVSRMRVFKILLLCVSNIIQNIIYTYFYLCEKGPLKKNWTSSCSMPLYHIYRYTPIPPTYASYRNVRDFGKLPWLLEKRRRRRKAVSISLLTSVAEGNFRRLRSLTGWRKCWYFFLPRLGANTCFEMSSHAFEKWGSLFGKSF